ncbi:MAG: hypothetical protein JZD40_04690 [Sulfolobus sp.]|nr:hypothetical protein [Sulfolobus sp.]
MWHWDYKIVFLRLSHPDVDFLFFLASYFHCVYFDFKGKDQLSNNHSKSILVSTIPSTICYILWLHWYEVGVHILPFHFAKYFSINTLAFWAMRNGQ